MKVINSILCCIYCFWYEVKFYSLFACLKTSFAYFDAPWLSKRRHMSQFISPHFSRHFHVFLLASSSSMECVEEKGWCVARTLLHQDKGLITIPSVTDKQHCLDKCQHHSSDVKACEFEQSKGKCLGHKYEIGMGNGHEGYSCWILAKCKPKGKEV